MLPTKKHKNGGLLKSGVLFDTTYILTQSVKTFHLNSLKIRGLPSPF